MDSVTARIRVAGRTNVEDEGEIYTYDKAVVLEFSSADDLRDAVTGAKVIRCSWRAPHDDRSE